MNLTKKYINQLSYEIVSAAIEVHRHLGPGLLESVYQKCFVKELRSRNFKVEAEKQIPILYKGEPIHESFRIDLLVEDLIIIENKAVEIMHPVYTAQLLTYLKLTGKPKGLLINFNCEKITKDLVPLVTEKFRLLPEQ